MVNTTSCNHAIIMMTIAIIIVSTEVGTRMGRALLSSLFQGAYLP
jgi:hypothetical protein